MRMSPPYVGPLHTVQKSCSKTFHLAKLCHFDSTPYSQRMPVHGQGPRKPICSVHSTDLTILQALVSIHGENGGMAEGFLSPEETSIIQGALDLTSLTARHAMTPLDKVSGSPCHCVRTLDWISLARGGQCVAFGLECMHASKVLSLTVLMIAHGLKSMPSMRGPAEPGIQ